MPFSPTPISYLATEAQATCPYLSTPQAELCLTTTWTPANHVPAACSDTCPLSPLLDPAPSFTSQTRGLFFPTFPLYSKSAQHLLSQIPSTALSLPGNTLRVQTFPPPHQLLPTQPTVRTPSLYSSSQGAPASMATSVWCSTTTAAPSSSSSSSSESSAGRQALAASRSIFSFQLLRSTREPKEVETPDESEAHAIRLQAEVGKLIRPGFNQTLGGKPYSMGHSPETPTRHQGPEGHQGRLTKGLSSQVNIVPQSVLKSGVGHELELQVNHCDVLSKFQFSFLFM